MKLNYHDNIRSWLLILGNNQVKTYKQFVLKKKHNLKRETFSNDLSQLDQFL